MNQLFLSAPPGWIRIVSNGQAITCVQSVEHPGKDSPDSLCHQAAVQIQEYFAGSRQVFNLPLEPAGTPFQTVVWKTLLMVPFGQTLTYGQLALQAGFPKAARAVGAAMRANPIVLLIPCHRVVQADGPGNYSAFSGPETKRWLLEHESALVSKVHF